MDQYRRDELFESKFDKDTKFTVYRSETRTHQKDGEFSYAVDYELHCRYKAENIVIDKNIDEMTVLPNWAMGAQRAFEQFKAKNPVKEILGYQVESQRAADLAAGKLMAIDFRMQIKKQEMEKKSEQRMDQLKRQMDQDKKHQLEVADQKLSKEREFKPKL